MKQNFGCSERTTKQKNIIIQNEEQRKNYNEKRKKNEKSKTNKRNLKNKIKKLEIQVN